MRITAVAEQIRQRATSWREGLARLLNLEKRPVHADAKPTTKPRVSEDGRTQRANPVLLGNKKAVNFHIAEQYLGITERQRQKLIRKGALDVIGGGNGRLITTESLRRYLPPAENPN